MAVHLAEQKLSVSTLETVDLAAFAARGYARAARMRLTTEGARGVFEWAEMSLKEVAARPVLHRR